MCIVNYDPFEPLSTPEPTNPTRVSPSLATTITVNGWRSFTHSLFASFIHRNVHIFVISRLSGLTTPSSSNRDPSDVLLLACPQVQLTRMANHIPPGNRTRLKCLPFKIRAAGRDRSWATRLKGHAECGSCSVCEFRAARGVWTDDDDYDVLSSNPLPLFLQFTYYDYSPYIRASRHVVDLATTCWSVSQGTPTTAKTTTPSDGIKMCKTTKLPAHCEPRLGGTKELTIKQNLITLYWNV